MKTHYKGFLKKKKREKEFILVMFVSLETISKIIITNLADPVYFK